MKKKIKNIIKHPEKIKRKKSPFDLKDTPTKNVNWVSPKLVAEIGFTE